MKPAEAQAAVRAWNEQHLDPAIPVFVDNTTDDEEVEFTESGAFLSGNPGDEGRVALIRLTGRHWLGIELSRVTIHPRAAELQALPELGRAPELEFPPPDCSYCEIPLQHDGDGWDCEQCRASWASDGYSNHTRRCVEADCGSWATLVGADGQPRCPSCSFLILLQVLEPTGPYDCRETYCQRKQITGMPANARAWSNRRCGSCQHRADQDARWASYQESRTTAGTR